MTISVMLPDNPSLPEFVELIGALATRASQAFAAANTLDQLEEARIEYLGDQRGQLRAFQVALGKLSKDDRPNAGRQFNAVKQQITDAYESRKRELSATAAPSAQLPDPTMPARLSGMRLF